MSSLVRPLSPQQCSYVQLARIRWVREEILSIYHVKPCIQYGSAQVRLLCRAFHRRGFSLCPPHSLSSHFKSLPLWQNKLQ
ncbi:hypothetical protein FocTR4_00007652 [Fusarium oxysporum f. sp. cubense]|uniref:Uncharacterized protein n=1 Tax=Fusarium oxysporum f. sp. cubense TaxID=61366 RepID=A0A5C6TJA2_FUSOC|nr:hypothetical protein FocTR4_00007652 [Fusarium oxysporum f. sp. cubense]